MQKPTDPSSATSTPAPQQVQKLSILQTIQHILATDGPLGFMRGVGPALILVINPVIQYTVFEQLKNVLVTRRTAALRAAGGAAAATALLTDLDFFFLGALSKFSERRSPYEPNNLLQNLHSCNWVDIPVHVGRVGRTRTYMSSHHGFQCCKK